MFNYEIRKKSLVSSELQKYIEDLSNEVDFYHEKMRTHQRGYPIGKFSPNEIKQLVTVLSSELNCPRYIYIYIFKPWEDTIINTGVVYLPFEFARASVSFRYFIELNRTYHQQPDLSEEVISLSDRFDECTYDVSRVEWVLVPSYKIPSFLTNILQ